MTVFARNGRPVFKADTATTNGKWGRPEYGVSAPVSPPPPPPPPAGGDIYRGFPGQASKRRVYVAATVREFPRT